MPKINWIHDTHFEDNCKELGVAWTYVENIKLSDIKLPDIDVKAS